MTDDRFAIRRGRTGDARVILALLDGAMEWLVSLGRTDQWGSNPASAEPARVARAQEWERDEGLYIATLDGEPVGALVVGEAMPYVPPATVPELYVRFLASDRTRKGSRIGARLLEHAETLARRAGVERLRVDCFRGPDLALVNYYRAQGFTPTETFTVPRPEADDWPGQILVRELAPTV